MIKDENDYPEYHPELIGAGDHFFKKINIRQNAKCETTDGAKRDPSFRQKSEGYPPGSKKPGSRSQWSENEAVDETFDF